MYSIKNVPIDAGTFSAVISITEEFFSRALKVNLIIPSSPFF
jgi:hypothetical protein